MLIRNPSDRQARTAARAAQNATASPERSFAGTTDETTTVLYGRPQTRCDGDNLSGDLIFPSLLDIDPLGTFILA